jgi:hypothetical protein
LRLELLDLTPALPGSGRVYRTKYAGATGARDFFQITGFTTNCLARQPGKSGRFHL